MAALAWALGGTERVGAARRSRRTAACARACAEKRDGGPVRRNAARGFGGGASKSGGTTRDTGASDGHALESRGSKSKSSGPVGPDEMVVAFTCSVCDTRVTKKIKKRSYNHGVVLIQCAGCQNRHLVADHLGWYPWLSNENQNTDMESIARSQGQQDVRRVSIDALEFLESGEVSLNIHGPELS
eukprot:CAMPEP_0185834234 /NCGR_PEP_ID=MMETSP1353-20130828/4836_1 /TAXON_ID=1077150 /ORGANISM="Erythrolobus australicus, Strain CCMP3124" /LENGTH=184 /DNA_ID=CAMNT_0028532633 /DNA_START=9 /DNA_END=563 /DNA_ORIENTATION=+